MGGWATVRKEAGKSKGCKRHRGGGGLKAGLDCSGEHGNGEGGGGRRAALAGAGVGGDGLFGHKGEAARFEALGGALQGRQGSAVHGALNCSRKGRTLQIGGLQGEAAATAPRATSGGCGGAVAH